MIRKTIAIAGLAICMIAVMRDARAQTPPPEDPRIAIYRQLLTQANDNVAALGAQAQQLTAENGKLKAENEELKKKAPDK